VFVDVVGTINDGDFETFKEKTDKIFSRENSRPAAVIRRPTGS
jgi:hypothetical protein